MLWVVVEFGIKYYLTPSLRTFDIPFISFVHPTLWMMANGREAC
jgi:hypothetical protein